MFRRGVTSAVKHHVRPLFAGGHAPNRAAPTTEFGWPRKLLPQYVAREAEAVKGEAEDMKGKARICKSDWPDIKLTGSLFIEHGDVGESVVSCVERKCTSQYRPFENLQRSIDVDFSDKPSLFVPRRINGRDQYFTALSVEEDANLTPKYDIYAPLPPQGRFVFSSSCSGIYCFFDDNGRIFLWNPTTNEFKILPPSQSFLETRPGVNNQMICSEIWFDRESDDFKVMRFFSVCFGGKKEDYSYYKQEFELYSLKSNSWKKISCPEFSCWEKPRACINGHFYVRASRKEETEVILSLDLSTGTFFTLPFVPFPDMNKLKLFYFQEYNGFLSSLVKRLNPNGYSLELWVMMNGSWTRESVFHTCGYMIPVSFWRNGKLLFLVSVKEELLLFDRGTGKLKHLGVFSPPDQLLVPFVESFAQLRC